MNSIHWMLAWTYLFSRSWNPAVSNRGLNYMLNILLTLEFYTSLLSRLTGRRGEGGGLAGLVTQALTVFGCDGRVVGRWVVLIRGLGGRGMFILHLSCVSTRLLQSETPSHIFDKSISLPLRGQRYAMKNRKWIVLTPQTAPGFRWLILAKTYAKTKVFGSHRNTYRGLSAAPRAPLLIFGLMRSLDI